MKGLYTFVLLLTIAITGYMFRDKAIHTQDDTDKLWKGLDGVEKELRPGTNIFLEATSQRAMFIFPVAYYLAPHLVGYDKKTVDTVLSIARVTDSDSAINALTGGQKLIWQNSDSQYHYFLTCSH